MKSTYNFTILFALYNTLNDWVLTHQFHYFTDIPQPCMFPLQETYSWCLAWQTFACLQDFALSLSYLDIPILHLYNRNILATPSKILFYRLKALLSLSVWYKTHVSFYMENSWSQNLFTQNWVDIDNLLIEHVWLSTFLLEWEEQDSSWLAVRSD